MEAVTGLGKESQRAELVRLLHKLHSRLDTISETITSELSALQADGASLTTVVGSATTLINGLAAQLSAAVAAAVASGATPAQLQGFADLDITLKAQTAALAAAVAAGTALAPTTPVAPVDSAPSTASTEPAAPAA